MEIISQSEPDQQRTHYPDELETPELLSIPPKLQPVLHEFNKYKIFILEGGRGSAKTQSVARIILYIMEKRVVRVLCGREIQATIAESVHAVFGDLIGKFTLAYHVTKAIIRCLATGSTIGFKGFRERGAINIKGVEGMDIVWVDEAQALTKPTLDALLPTLRKDTPVKFIFTMNRLHREDAVMELALRDDCLHIHIDYFENPYCPATLLDEAEMCRQRSERDYNHIWLGLPVKAGDEYIFDADALYASLKTTPYGDLFFKQKVIGIDWAAQGSDKCVATILERGSAEHWTLIAQIAWDEPNTSLSVGRILKMMGEHKPDVVIIDIGGGGYNTYCDLITAGHNNVFPFDGGSTKGISDRCINMRADGYWNLLGWFEQRWICIGEGYKDTLKQLERIKKKFRPDGRNQVREKTEYKQEHGGSPDEADSLVMAIYGIRYIGKVDKRPGAVGTGITRKTVVGRRRT